MVIISNFHFLGRRWIIVIKFEVYLGKDGAYYWRLKAANNEIVCWSEGYNSKQGAVNSVNWVKINGLTAPIIEI